MSDLLVQALMNSNKRYQQNDIYGQGANYLTNYSQQVMKDDSSDPNSALTASLISGLAGGLMSGYAQKAQRDYTTQLAESIRDASKNFYSTGDSSGFYNSPSQDVRQVAPLLDLERSQQQFQMDQQTQRSLLDNGVVMNRDQDGTLKFTRDPNLINILQEAKNGFIPDNVKPIAAKAIAGESLTPEENAALVNANRLDLVREGRYAKQMAGVQDRFNAGLEQKKATKNLFGYDFLTDSQLTDPEAAKLRDKIAQTNVLTGVFSQMASNPNLNPDEMFGNNAALTDALRAAAFQKLRMGAGTGANSGAALNPGEKAIIEDMNFATMATDPLGSIKRMMLGRDQKQFAKDMASVLQKLQDEEILTYGGIRSGVGPDYYNPDAINKYKNSSQLNDFGRQWFLSPNNQMLSGSQPITNSTPQMNQAPQMGGAPGPNMKKQVNPRTGEIRYVPR